jgi:hypothetical protein
MKNKFALMIVFFAMGLASLLFGAERVRYPAPRFPSYLKPPKSIDDVMPFARAAVRQTGGRTPLGLVEKGMTALIVAEVGADPMVMEAIKKAYEERGKYADYAKDPWKTVTSIFKRVDDGTYEYFYPKTCGKTLDKGREVGVRKQ